MKPRYSTEAELCAAFMAHVRGHYDVLGAYAEWHGWDVFVVFKDGRQLGVQAKLRLNAAVIQQAMQGVNDRWAPGDVGPDYRGILVPKANDNRDLAELLGLIVFVDDGRGSFVPWDPSGWIDWSPPRRLKLPPCETGSVAGSSAPVTLTPWKLRALDVLAELEVEGTITARRMAMLRVNPSRWQSGRWIEPTGERGKWRRGAKCPPFDQQHPEAYALALLRARGEELA